MSNYEQKYLEAWKIDAAIYRERIAAMQKVGGGVEQIDKIRGGAGEFNLYEKYADRKRRKAAEKERENAERNSEATSRPSNRVRRKRRITVHAKGRTQSLARKRANGRRANNAHHAPARRRAKKTRGERDPQRREKLLRNIQIKSSFLSRLGEEQRTGKRTP